MIKKIMQLSPFCYKKMKFKNSRNFKSKGITGITVTKHVQNEIFEIKREIDGEFIKQSFGPITLKRLVDLRELAVQIYNKLDEHAIKRTFYCFFHEVKSKLSEKDIMDDIEIRIFVLKYVDHINSKKINSLLLCVVQHIYAQFMQDFIRILRNEEMDSSKTLSLSECSNLLSIQFKKKIRYIHVSHNKIL